MICFTLQLFWACLLNRIDKKVLCITVLVALFDRDSRKTSQ